MPMLGALASESMIVPPPKALACSRGLAGAPAEQGVEQRFHGEVAGEQRVDVAVLAAPHLGQHEVVDAADLERRVKKADGNAGTEQRR
jgi:hypothetical protein